MINGIIFTIILLGIIVFVHELGHFLTAKYFKMPVIEFAIGMGPKLISKKIGETVYSIRILPLGGFVNIAGMQEEEIGEEELDEEEKEYIKYINENGFYTKKPFEKFIVLIAGVVMNFLTAILVIYFILVVFNDVPKKYVETMGENINFLEKIPIAIDMFTNYFVRMIDGLIRLIGGSVSPKEMTGPVGLPKIVGEAYKMAGYEILYDIFVLLSINIGIMNLLPIPALDGGRLIFVILEFFNVKMNKKLEEKIHYAGMIFLMILMAFIVFNDVGKYF